MTFATACLIIFSASLPIAFFCLWGFYARLHLERLNSYQEWCDKFFALTKQLLNNDLPDDWRAILAGMNEAITYRHAAYIVYEAYAPKHRGRLLINREGMSTEEKQFVSDNIELTDLFIEACKAAFLAMSYTHLFWGVKARAGMADRFARKSKPVTAVHDVEQVERTFQRLVAA